jgi:hypothetical protein
MANTLTKLRELSASLKADAAALRRDRVYMCCVGTYEYAAAHIDAIVRESDAQVDAGAVDAWERRLRGRAGPFTAQAGERYVDADVALEAFRFALAASAERAQTAEGRESECPWGGCGDCVGHEVIQPAGDGARVTLAAKWRQRADQIEPSPECPGVVAERAAARAEALRDCADELEAALAARKETSHE